MQSKFEAAIRQICEEKNLNIDIVVAAIESAISAAYRKEYGTEFQKIAVEFDMQTGMARIFNLLEVVDTVEYPDSQISKAAAKKKKKTSVIGDRIRVEVTPKGDEALKYGRIAAQTAKQVIIQRLQEAERDAIFEKYKDRAHEIVASQVQRVESNGIVFLTIEGTTVLLYPNEQISREKYFNGQRMHVYIAKVERTSKGPSIIVSRTHPKLIQKLLEMEVPEIAEGTVEVKALSREAGVRTKIAVASKQEGIDPVGSCVGQRGVRIQAITNEIGDEKIDIIEYSDDIVQMIINTLSPAKITSIELTEEGTRAKVYVMEDQRSLAIGKNGQNVRLASKLLGLEIDILDFVGDPEALEAEVPEAAEIENDAEEATDMPISQLKSVGEEAAAMLADNNLHFVSDLDGKKNKDLVELGLDKKIAKSILAEIAA